MLGRCRGFNIEEEWGRLSRTLARIDYESLKFLGPNRFLCKAIPIEKGIFRCFVCGKHGNQLDLFAAALKLPIYAAAVELCRRLDVELPINRQ